MKKFNVHLAVTKITKFDCQKKNILELLIQYLSIPQYIETKSEFLLGNIIHRIMQITLRYKIPEIEYLYFNKYKTKESLKNVIYIVLENVFSSIQEVFEFKFAKTDTKYSRKTLESVFNKVHPILKNLSELSIRALKVNKNEIKSYVVDDELDIRYEIFDYNIIILGRIDLILYNPDSKTVTIIELKTGKKYPDHSNQILIYGEILKSKYKDLKIEMEIWYPNLKSYEIIEFKNSEDIFNKIKKSINDAEKIVKLKNFPENFKKLKSKINCSNLFCNLCEEYEDEIKKKLKEVDITPMNYFF